MTGWRRPAGGTRQVSVSPEPAPGIEIGPLIDAAYQESARADGKSAALLAVVGIGFAAFCAAGASATAAPPRGAALWLCITALAGVCIVAELLLLALRPAMSGRLAGQQYFGTWRRYDGAPDMLAATFSADPSECRTLIRLSSIVWRKYLLVRWAVDVLMGIVPLVAVSLSVALLLR